MMEHGADPTAECAPFEDRRGERLHFTKMSTGDLIKYITALKQLQPGGVGNHPSTSAGPETDDHQQDGDDASKEFSAECLNKKEVGSAGILREDVNSQSGAESEGQDDEMEGGEESQAKKGKKAKKWGDHESLLLIEIKKEEWQRENSGIKEKTTRKYSRWRKVSEALATAGVTRTGPECRRRWDVLRNYYKKVKEFKQQDGAKSYWDMNPDERRACHLPAGLSEKLFHAMDSWVSEKDPSIIWGSALGVYRHVLPPGEQAHTQVPDMPPAAPNSNETLRNTVGRKKRNRQQAELSAALREVMELSHKRAEQAQLVFQERSKQMLDEFAAKVVGLGEHILEELKRRR